MHISKSPEDNPWFSVKQCVDEGFCRRYLDKVCLFVLYMAPHNHRNPLFATYMSVVFTMILVGIIQGFRATMISLGKKFIRANVSGNGFLNPVMTTHTAQGRHTKLNLIRIVFLLLLEISNFVSQVASSLSIESDSKLRRFESKKKCISNVLVNFFNSCDDGTVLGNQQFGSRGN